MKWERVAALRASVEAGTLGGVELIGALTTDGTFVKRMECGLEPGSSAAPLLMLLAAGLESDDADMRLALVQLLDAAINSSVLENSAGSLLQRIIRLSYLESPNAEELKVILEELGYMLIIMRECISRSLSKAATLLPQIETVRRLGEQTVVEEKMGQAMRDDFARLNVAADSLVAFVANGEEQRIQSKRKTRRQVRQEGCEASEPPEDFRTLPLVPTPDDVLERSPYLRRNVVKGPFEDTATYLDIQFRLLREDYICDLRKGIEAYMPHDGPNVNKDLQLYRNARMESSKVAKSGLTFTTVVFDIKPFARLKWETSKRLIFGSLVCLSSDNFRDDLVFGVVQNRDLDRLRKGRIDVTFEHVPMADQREKVYVMAATSAYFEAYRHVLEGLKRLNSSNFPFREQIVDCIPRTRPPLYMGGLGLDEDNFGWRYGNVDGGLRSRNFLRLPPNCLNFQPLVSPELQHQSWDVEVGRRSSWPTKEEFGDRGLDESQFEALFHALNHRIAIIQGPPGTGKTFIGLLLMRLLLDKSNQRLWNPSWRNGYPRYINVNNEWEEEWDCGRRGRRPRPQLLDTNGTPILVVCYTNHALDQFLEGLVDFELGPETKIVRIGGRSKVERLEEFGLHKARRAHPMGNDIREEFFNRRRSMQSLWESLVEATAEMRLLETDLPDIGCFHFRRNNLDNKPMESARAQMSRACRFSSALDWILGGAELQKQMRWLAKVAEVQEATERPEPYAIAALKRNSEYVPRAIAWLKATPEVRAGEGGPELSCASLGELVSEDTGAVLALIALAQAHNDPRAAKEWLRNTQADEEDVGMARAPTAAELFEDYAEERKLESDSDRLMDFEAEIEKMKCKLMGDKFISVRRFKNFLDAVEGADEGFQTVRSLHGVSREWNTLKTKILATPPMSRDEMMLVAPSDVATLPIERRWGLLNAWRLLLQAESKNTVRETEQDYVPAAQSFKEIQHISDIQVMRAASVIGMTTTAAARYMSVLQTIKPPIVIVEEAAEVFEAHLITSLSSGTQHLIMIGDHQQLRPSPAVYALGKDYQLDISLFERLVKNDFPYAQLAQQHRMRPEISRSLMPHFYANLRDHPDVKAYSHVDGMRQDMVFFNHSAPEASDDQGEKSRKNMAEAAMVEKLALYLRQNDIAAARITILACYVGQMYEIRNRLKRDALTQDIRITVVDNYQGEESDIIILSMVRCNSDGRIGFLATDNRVCVALSRAKMGFFCLGNFDFLAAHSRTWAAIRDSLRDHGQLLHHFPIGCVNHPEVAHDIRNPAEFALAAPDGGCTRNCEQKLICGHSCRRKCHSSDRAHEKVFCRERCERRCGRGHTCAASCGFGVTCPPCRAPFAYALSCGHKKEDKCYLELSKVVCSEPCPKTLRCGHVCGGRCSDICPPCAAPVRKRLLCLHDQEVACYEKGEFAMNIDCLKLVPKVWPDCQHTSDLPCSKNVATEPCPRPCRVEGCKETCGACRTAKRHR